MIGKKSSATEMHRGSHRYQFMRAIFLSPDGLSIHDALKWIKAEGFQPSGRWGAHAWLLDLANCYLAEIRDGRIDLNRNGTSALLQAYPELVREGP